MCLAAVYINRGDGAPKELVLDKVQVIDVDGAKLTCRNLFGQTAEIEGFVTRIDLENSTVEVAQGIAERRGV